MTHPTPMPEWLKLKRDELAAENARDGVFISPQKTFAAGFDACFASLLAKAPEGREVDKWKPYEFAAVLHARYAEIEARDAEIERLREEKHQTKIIGENALAESYKKKIAELEAALAAAEAERDFLREKVACIGRANLTCETLSKAMETMFYGDKPTYEQLANKLQKAEAVIDEIGTEVKTWSHTLDDNPILLLIAEYRKEK